MRRILISPRTSFPLTRRRRAKPSASQAIYPLVMNDKETGRPISLSSLWNGSNSGGSKDKKIPGLPIPTHPASSSPSSSTATKSSKPTPLDDALVNSTAMNTAGPTTTSPPKKKKKTIAELDEELRLKMSGLAGDGGESGVEYKDGEPVAMKRSVKNNMFRYI